MTLLVRLQLRRLREQRAGRLYGENMPDEGLTLVPGRMSRGMEQDP